MVAEQSGVIDFVKDTLSYVHSPTSRNIQRLNIRDRNLQRQNIGLEILVGRQRNVSDYFGSSSDFVPVNSDCITSLFNAERSESGSTCKVGVNAERCEAKSNYRVGFNTLVLDWYIELLDPPQSYLEHLDYFRSHDRNGNFAEYEAGGSIEGFYFYKHRGEGEIEMWAAVPDVRCDPYNPCAKFKSIRSSASRTYSHLRNLKGCENIVFLDLTFPGEISQKLLNPNRSDILNKARSCVDRFIELLKENLSSHINENKSGSRRQDILPNATLGYQFNPHIWSTEDPTSPHLHIHLDLLWAFYHKEKLHPLKFHDKGKPLGGDFVRALWKRAISEIFDYDFEGKDTSIHLAWAPLSWGGKVLHRLKYRRRKPITDLAEYYQDHEFNPDNFDHDFNRFLLDYTNRSHTCGFWCFLVRLLKDKSSLSANVKVCPVCGEKVSEEVYIPIGEAVFDRVVILDRSGTAYSVKPPPRL